MSELVRLSLSLDKKLVDQFDRQIAEQHYPTRSKAIGDLIRESLARRDWIHGKSTAGAILMVYDHHKRNLLNRLTDTQHDHHNLIIATQHIHLDHDNCLEIVVVRGKPAEIESLYHKLKAIKGIKHCSLAASTTGASLS